jgi:inosine-uridine nucleoside N-ribohydrolase
VLAAASSESNAIKIEGISVVDGNTDSITALACLKELLTLYPDYKSLPLFTKELAPSAIARLKESTALLALGPLTNIAKALEINPTIAINTCLYWVGGVANPLSFRRRLSNLNIHRDRAAASLVLSQWRSSYQFPLDVIDQLCIGDAELEALKSTGAIGSYLALNSQDWLRTSWLRHGRN